MRNTLSIVIPTFNEEKNLPKCLASIKPLDVDIFVVDSYSTDKTVEIAREHGCQVFQGSWRTFAEKINWAINNLPIKTPWMMRIDSDEELTKELGKELGIVLPEAKPELAAFAVKQRFYFLGKWIRYGGKYPSWQVRVWRKGCAHMEQRELDEHMVVNSPTGKLKHDIIDNNLKELSFWIHKHNLYSDKEVMQDTAEPSYDTNHLIGQAARRRWMKGKIYYRMPLFLRAFLYWIYRYFILLGFLDGRPGLIYHFLHGFWYRFLIDSKIYEKKMINLWRAP